MKWDVFMNFTQRQKLVCNSQSVWGKITPMKWAVFIKLYPMSKARMSLSKILPQTSKKFTQIYLPYLLHYATLTVGRRHLATVAAESLDLISSNCGRCLQPTVELGGMVLDLLSNCLIGIYQLIMFCRIPCDEF